MVGWAVLVALGVVFVGVLAFLISFLVDEDAPAGWAVALIAAPVVASAVAYRMAGVDWPGQPNRSIAATVAGGGVAVAAVFLAVSLFGII